MSQRLIKRARERLAQEEGTTVKDWGGRIPVALVYPNTYPVAMSNLGLLTVYHLLNTHPDVVCERAFLREEDALETPRLAGTPYVSMEGQRALSAFEIIAFSISFENDYPNVLQILNESGIPVLRKDRSHQYPLVIAGGPAVFLNPEPLAEVIDLFLLGEAEELLGEFLALYRENRYLSRRDLTHALRYLEGAYIPEFYTPRYNEEGLLVEFQPQEGAPARVKRRWVKDIDAYPTVASVTTPETEFGGMFLMEVGRGCGRMCPFCSTGVIYRPLRYRSPHSLQEAVSKGIDKGQRLGLVCASLGDYPYLKELYALIREREGAISAPSIRLDTLEEGMLQMLKESGQRTITLAAEAGSERLRRAVGKVISNEGILETIDQCAAHGLFGVRLYFMVGLPTETDEDVEAIIDLVTQIRHRFLKAAKDTARMGEITLSVNPFVPKPWSAFQWAPMEDEGVLKDRLTRIRRSLRREPNVYVTHGVPKWAYVQSLFSRGDRRVGAFLYDYVFAQANWKRLFRSSSLNPDFFVYRERTRDELFPWDFIDHGISKEFLYREYEKAMHGLMT